MGIKSIFNMGTPTLLIAIILVGCSYSSTVVKSKPPSHAVVFVPGLYGSRLKQADNSELIWGSPSKMLFTDYSLHLCHGLFRKPCARIVSDGLLRSVDIIPLVYSQNAYGRAFDSLEQALGDRAKLIPFAYDWRQDIPANSMRLSQFIEQLKTTYDTVDAVGHSMGGLLLGYYLLCPGISLETCNPGTVEPVIKNAALLGTPFQGSAVALVNFIKGRNFGPNTTMMTAKAYGSFPSIYQATPFNFDFTMDEHLKSLNGFILSAKNWRSEGWGIFSEPSLLKSLDATETFVQKNIDRGIEFNKTLFENPKAHQSWHQHHKLFIIQGTGHKTLAKVAVIGNKAVNTSELWKENFHDKPVQLFEDGDETVTYQSSTPPKSLLSIYEMSKGITRFPHGDMFDDRDVVKSLVKLFTF